MSCAFRRGLDGPAGITRDRLGCRKSVAVRRVFGVIGRALTVEAVHDAMHESELFITRQVFRSADRSAGQSSWDTIDQLRCWHHDRSRACLYNAEAVELGQFPGGAEE